MKPDADHEKERWLRQAEQEKEWWRRQAEQEKEWWRQQAEDPEQQAEWLRQDNLTYGGLIVVGIYMVQPFLTAASLDLSAKICVVAFSIAIPLLAALMLLNQQEAFRRHATSSLLVTVAQSTAQMAAFIGVVAGFWHITWIAGAGILASGAIGLGVHSAGYTRLERDQQPKPHKDGESGDDET